MYKAVATGAPDACRCMSPAQRPAAAVPRCLKAADTALESRAGGHAFGPGPGCVSVLSGASRPRPHFQPSVAVAGGLPMWGGAIT